MAGRLVIIIGPSGSGKTELVKALLKEVPYSSRLITVTTRSPRIGEINGRDFHFISKEAFQNKIDEGDFFEYAETHGHFYGCSEKILRSSLASHNYVFAIIDVKGAQVLKKHFPDALAIFVDCGSIDTIKTRLMRSRKDISKEELDKRLATAAFELNFMNTFDTVLPNPDGKFNEAVARLKSQLV